MAIARLAGHLAAVLFSATHTVSKVEVTRALDQEMGEARQGGEDMRVRVPETSFFFLEGLAR